MAGFCEHGNETAGCKNSGEVGDRRLTTKQSAFTNLVTGIRLWPGVYKTVGRETISVRQTIYHTKKSETREKILQE